MKLAASLMYGCPIHFKVDMDGLHFHACAAVTRLAKV